MQFETLKNMTISELYQKIVDLKKEKLNINMLSVSGQSTNRNRLRSIRRDVARIMTRINQLRKSA